jgi:Leucine-rich repeat (LRR) protein
VVDQSFGADSGADSGWWDVVDLQKLILSHNRISVLSDRIGTLEFLTHLDLNHNKLAQVNKTNKFCTTKVDELFYEKIRRKPILRTNPMAFTTTCVFLRHFFPPGELPRSRTASGTYRPSSRWTYHTMRSNACLMHSAACTPS